MPDGEQPECDSVASSILPILWGVLLALTPVTAGKSYVHGRIVDPARETNGWSGALNQVFVADPTGSHVNVYDYPNVCT